MPSFALAWGPGVHLGLADWVMQHISLLPPVIGTSILRYPSAFRYGSLSADFMVGKGSAIRPGHSHNWETGLQLLQQAKAHSEPMTVWAYGYLSHLAADTVAHNHFVPTLMSTAPAAGKVGHVYIEMQADNMVCWNRASAKELFSTDFRQLSRQADTLLESSVAQGKVPFSIKKHIFRSSVLVSSRQQWRSSLKLAAKATPATPNKKLFATMLDAAGYAVIRCLRNPDYSSVTRIDPIGQKALADAAALCNGRRMLSFRSPFPHVFPLHKALRCQVRNLPAPSHILVKW